MKDNKTSQCRYKGHGTLCLQNLSVKITITRKQVYIHFSTCRHFRVNHLSYKYRDPGGGRGTPLYKLYRYVPPQRVWFLSRFGLKMGIDFDHYGLKSGMVYKGTTGAYKRICLFNSK